MLTFFSFFGNNNSYELRSKNSVGVDKETRESIKHLGHVRLHVWYCKGEVNATLMVTVR